MKKLFFIVLLCFVTLYTNAQYVDLGLPSGTRWKSQNESGDFYSYDEAAAKFGNKLPAMWQWNELKDNCTWSWIGSGYTISGKNGNSIYLPTTGCRTPSGHIKGMADRGFYWTFTPSGLDGVLLFFFNSSDIRVNEDSKGGGCAVRLIK